VRVVYSDESGLFGPMEKQPVTVVTAILLNMDSHWMPVHDDLVAVVRATPKRLLADGELKGAELLKGVRKQVPGAAETLAAVLRTTVANLVPIFYGAVDRAGCKRKSQRIFTREIGGGTATPYERAFEACLERVLTYMHASCRKEKVLWIADHGHNEAEAKARLREARMANRILDRPSLVADTIYFGHSHESLALQLADVCCSTVTQMLLETYYGRHTLGKPFYEIIRNQLNGQPPERDALLV
jgi:Protein of unknown function (DUF3800)